MGFIYRWLGIGDQAIWNGAALHYRDNRIGLKHLFSRGQRMLGTVAYVDKRTGHFIIRDEVGEFTLAQIMGKYNVPRGCILVGKLQNSGCEMLENQTTNEMIPVLLLAAHCSERDVLNKLRKAKRQQNML